MSKDVISRNNSEDGLKSKSISNPVLQEVETREQVAVTREETFSGPLPSPETLNGYERVITGAADRIIKMAENQMQHRHKVEENFLNTHSRNTLLGIVAAFILGAIICIGGIICVLNDKQVSGLIFGGVGLAAVVTAFLKGTNPQIKAEASEEEIEE